MKHPGIFFYTVWVSPRGYSIERVAHELRVSRSVVAGLFAGTMNVDPDIAARLSKYTGKTRRYWLDLQVSYDLEQPPCDHLVMDLQRIHPIGMWEIPCQK